jgi:RNA polymerase sigma-70 factor, ECF subfamily
MEADDNALLEAARNGDRNALEALIARHEAQVYRFGMKMCRDPEDARDVLQDTLIAMARGVRSFRGASSISTWLFAIARSFCIKKRRRRKSEPRALRSLDTDAAVEAGHVVDPASHPDETIAGKEVAQAVEQAIAALDPGHREVLVLRDIEGLKATEVAEVLGISVEAVKSRLHRARLAVRNRVAPLLGASDDAAASSTCPDVLRMFSQHLEDEISPDVCIQMERHLERCARCRSSCDSLKRTLALCQASPAAPVPAAVQESVRGAIRKLLAAPEHDPG